MTAVPASAGPNIPIPAREETLDAAVANVKAKMAESVDLLGNVLKTQAKVALKQLADSAEEGVEIGKKVVQGMANVAEMLAKGDIDQETANTALSQRMMALENLALAERNEAAQIAAARARDTFAAISSVLLGLVSAGMSVVSPAIGVGLSKALGALAEE